MSARLFVTSSGTDIGKTYVTALLIRQLKAKGHEPYVLKPVVSGFDPDHASESDPGVLLAAQGRPLTDDVLDEISPWRFAAALAPDMAARREGRDLKFDEVVEFCRKDRKADITIIEGVGGVMAPIAQGRLNIDWLATLQIPALLVVGSYLGTISHTLTAANALKTRYLTLAGIVISESEESPVPLEETADAIGAHVPGVSIAMLARRGPDDWESHPDLTYLMS